MNNIVIKVLNVEHGKKVIEFFKSKGFDTRTCTGHAVTRYYGVLNNVFNWYSFEEIANSDAKIITLPEDLPIPRMVLVRNLERCTWKKKPLLADLHRFGVDFPYICGSAENPNIHSGWRYMKEIEEVQEMTLEEVCKELGREIKIIK